jgi:hypothetical protein
VWAVPLRCSGRQFLLMCGTFVITSVHLLLVS